MTDKKRFLDPMASASLPILDFAETFPKIACLVRHPVRCGKPNCRCARGELHESWRLVWAGADGRQCHRYVRQADLDTVRAILDLRRQQRMLERLTLRFGRERVRRLEQWVREYETTNHS